MDYFRSVPSEIYREALFLLEPKDVFHVCGTNKYALTICDDEFYREYIDRNFDPRFYGLEKFLLPAGLNWNQFLNILVYGITLSGDIKDYRANIIDKIKVTINLKDTLRNIWTNVTTIINNTYKNLAIITIVIVANIGTKNMRLILFQFHSYLETPSHSIENQSRRANVRRPIPIDTLMSQIGEDGNFYFNMVNFWVSIQKKFEDNNY
jgi:hypothetical protein